MVSAGSFLKVLDDSDCNFFTDSSCAIPLNDNKIRSAKKGFFIVAGFNGLIKWRKINRTVLKKPFENKE